MATSTELLRAAEHMHLSGMRDGVGAMVDAAKECQREAKRLQTIEARQTKRSWPEGWPPFAVLRRAFYAMGVSHKPSTASVERHACGPSEADFARRKAAKGRRHAWARAVKIEMLETITISDPSSP